MRQTIIPLPSKQIVLVTEDGSVMGPYKVVSLEYRQIDLDIEQVTVTTLDVPA